MRDLPWKGEFDGAFCFGNSFGYLDHNGAIAFLSAMARALRPGARLILDVPTVAECILPSLARSQWHRADDIILLSETRYQAEHSRMDIDYTFIRGPVMETRSSSSFVFTVAEVRRLLEKAGFTVVAMHGSTAGESFELGSPSLLLSAQLTA